MKDDNYMSNTPAFDTQSEESNEGQKFLIGVIVGIAVLTILLIVLAVMLAIYAEETGPAVAVIRDLLITALGLELVITVTALVIFLVQIARFINLLNNEIEPIITSTQDTVNTVRGTAAFLSKNVTEPIISVTATLRGIGKIMGDVDSIRKAAGFAAAAASAASPTGTRSEQPSADLAAEETEDPESSTEDNTTNGDISDDGMLATRSTLFE